MPGKPLDLRKNKPVAPNPAAKPQSPIPGVGGNSQLPLPQGTVLKLTKTEEDYLKSLDWTPGDPIPDVAALVETLKNEMVLPDENMPRAAKPREIDINDLPPERQAELRKSVADMIAQTKNLQHVAAQHVADPSNPDVNRHIDQLLTDTPNGGKFHVPTPPPYPTRDAATPVPNSQKTAESNAMSTMSDAQLICNNCNQDPEADPVTVSEDDKLNFVTMMVSGVPFMKEYEMLGGRTKVVFRSLSRLELDLAVSQAGCDTRDGVLPTEGEFFRAMQNYEMIMSLHQIKTTGGETVEFPPSIGDVQYDLPEADAPFQTVLKTYVPHVLAQINSSSMYRLLSVLYRQFYALIRRLEANSFNPDFWKGIKTST